MRCGLILNRWRLLHDVFDHTADSVKNSVKVSQLFRNPSSDERG
jgi:hypothetical protein